MAKKSGATKRREATARAVSRAGVDGINKPKLTPGAKKKAVVVTVVDGKPKTIRFGDPEYGHNYDAQARADFKRRHAKNIAKGPSSAAYWADKFLWSKGGRSKPQPKK